MESQHQVDLSRAREHGKRLDSRWKMRTTNKVMKSSLTARVNPMIRDCNYMPKSARRSSSCARASTHMDDHTKLQNGDTDNLRHDVLIHHHIMGMTVPRSLLITRQSLRRRLHQRPWLLARRSLRVQPVRRVRRRVARLRVGVVCAQTAALEEGGARSVRDELRGSFIVSWAFSNVKARE